MCTSTDIAWAVTNGGLANGFLSESEALSGQKLPIWRCSCSSKGSYGDKGFSEGLQGPKSAQKGSQKGFSEGASAPFRRVRPLSHGPKNVGLAKTYKLCLSWRSGRTQETKTVRGPGATKRGSVQLKVGRFLLQGPRARGSLRFLYQGPFKLFNFRSQPGFNCKGPRGASENIGLGRT